MSLPIFQLSHRLLLLSQFLLYTFVLFLLYPLPLLFGVDHPFLGIVQCLLELCKLRVYPLSFGLVLLHLLLALLDLQPRDLLFYLLQSQMDFLHHSLNYYIYRYIPYPHPYPRLSLSLLHHLCPWFKNMKIDDVSNAGLF